MKPASRLLYESEETLIYREESPDGPRIRKVLRAVTPDPDQILQFTNEFEYTKALHLPGVRKAFALHRENGQYSLLLDYIDGQTLGEAFVGRDRPLETVLRLFSTVADTLGRLHERGIIHKDLHDQNILWVEAEQVPILIDFGIAVRLDLVANNLGNPERIKGRLTHLSPEQTGRLNRKVDRRSDFYSLGVTLFLVLTGQLPFQATDPLELVHAHIARNPPLAHHLTPAVPEALANVVAKLLAKNAEERYQSAQGLKADLDYCLTQYLEKGRIDSFELGKTDFSGKFQIPQKLYGRYEEVKTLLKAFDRISRGSVELFLVGGYSGVGKTALIAEIYKPVTEKRGYFVGGKFDQYQRNLPYFAFKQALGEFCNLLLTERPDSLTRWRERIQASLGDNGQVLLDLIPELETVLGPQPEVPRLESQEATNRFNLTFSNFIKAIARPEHPFVLFLDDLQWADAASLNLTHLLVTDVSQTCLLLIGAYRDNEVSAGHPLLNLLDTAQEAGAVLNSIALRPLREEHLFQLIRESLQTDESTVQTLTELVFSKTGGNAFFTLEFLKSLNQLGMIQFSPQRRQWEVDFDKIQRQAITDNVVDLLLSRMVLLPPATQTALKIAACVGGLFELNLLALLTEKSPKETLKALWTATEEGLVSPVGEAYQYADILRNEPGFKIEFEFSHDRVHQAAYSLADEAERAEIHLKIGRHLQTRLAANREKPVRGAAGSGPGGEHPVRGAAGSAGPEELDPILFDLVNHLNAGSGLMTDPAECAVLTRLNLRAAVKARDASAYQSALAYVNQARRLAGEDIWAEDYPFALDLHKTAADVDYLTGGFSEAQNLLQQCLEKARTPAEKSGIYFLTMQIQSNTARYHEAIESARQGLKLLDFEFPGQGSEAEALIPGEMGKILTYFGEHGVEGVYEKEAMSDSRLLSIMDILDNLTAPTYTSGELSLWVLHVLLKANLTVAQGLTPQGGYSFSELGLVFFILGQYEFAFPSAQLSKRVAEKYAHQSPRHLSRTGHLYTNYNLPWVRHIGETFPLSPEYYQRSLESGELIFAGYLSQFPFFNAYYLGKDSLEALLSRLPDALEFTKKIRHDLAHDSLRALYLVMANLAGKTAEAGAFDTPGITEAGLLAYCQEVNNAFASTVFFAFKAQALYLDGKPEAALVCLETALPLAVTMSGCVSLDTLFRFTYPLTLLALLDRADAETQAAYWTQIEGFRGQLATWATHNPANFEHKLLLVKAEIARVKGEKGEAIDLYNRALASAERHGFERELALIHQRAGEFWLGVGNAFYARPHLETARYRFGLLGYNRVTDGLDAAFASLLTAPARTGKEYLSAKTYLTRTTSTRAEDFDLQSVLKAASALSEEIVLDRLLEKTLGIALENAGGQRAVLLLQDWGKWRVVAELDLEAPRAEPFTPTDLDEATNLPVTLINYVIRIGAEVMSGAEGPQKTFDRDPYLMSRKPASYLALPLLFKGESKGILYLEHQTSTEAFAAAGLNVLRTLTSQMAASLENASLYKHQSDLNAAYERFVPHEFLRALGHRSILQAGLGDTIDQDMTVLFCDIRSYSSLAEGMSPEDNFRFINGYLRRVGPVIRENGGFINHYLGDGFIALFKDRPEDAVRASLQLRGVIDEYNQQRQADGRVPIGVGIGLHTGRVMMGIIGDAERHDANVISDAVNIASRLEELTKFFGSTVLLSERTLLGVGNGDEFAFRFLGRIQVRGREDVLHVYEVINADPPALRDKKLQTLELFKTGLNDYFSRHFAEAAVSLKKVVNQNPDDKTAQRYLLHAARYLVETPAEDWNGVERMGEK